VGRERKESGRKGREWDGREGEEWKDSGVVRTCPEKGLRH